MRLWRRVMTERRRVVVPLLVLLVANAAVLLLVVLPLERSVANREAEALDARAEFADARMQDFMARTARASTQEADEGLREFYTAVLPQSFDEAVDVTGFWLTDLATRTGVRFQRGQYDVDHEPESSLQRMTAKAGLTGDYAGVRRFLHAVENAGEFVIIDRIELAQPNDIGEGRLELLLDVSTYYRRRGESRGRPGGGAQ